jgi:hypothetical protein
MEVAGGKRSQPSERNMLGLHPRKFDLRPHFLKYEDYRMLFEEADMVKNYALSDVVAKTMYLSLAAAALVFVSMLLLAGAPL